MRESIVSVLMSPYFSYRVDLLDSAAAPRTAGTAPVALRMAGGETVRPLSPYALASRLSYFLWSSMPDDELLRHAAAGDLERPEVLLSEAHRMLKDDKARGFVTEFAGNWLDFRRFELHNAVDRARFPSFTNELREAMYQEPIRLILDTVQHNRSVLDLIYGKYTFVNPTLAKHYGMPAVSGGDDHWVRVDNADEYGRGGLLPMSVFLTANSPGLRTSPVKRGYWVVRRVLGEVIPPPPPVVPELPSDEALSDLPLREMLAKHRANPACASCHERFDVFGLAFENYGPVGESRTKDLAGRPVDTRASLPGGVEAEGLQGVEQYIREHRQKDYLENLSRKLLAYGLGRTLQLSDDVTVQKMEARLTASGYRFDILVDAIVTSPQFLNRRYSPARGNPQVSQKKVPQRKGD